MQCWVGADIGVGTRSKPGLCCRGWRGVLTVMLWLLGTTLTRSGIVSSVHAFAQSSIGNWFVGFLALILVVCFVAYVKNRDYLKSENHLDSIISRESSFLFNNLI